MRKHYTCSYFLLFTLLLSSLFHQANGQVVISQVYGGGGNTGATYKNDFVELFNRGTTSQTITGWSVQYASATGTGNFSSNGVVTLSGTLAPGQYYLVKLAGGANGLDLPTADATSATPNLSGTGGKVVLVNNNTGLACNGGSTPCTSLLSNIVDLVGFGSANYFEGSGATAAPSNSTAAIRKLNGCTDTDNNSSDFIVGTPAPRNSSSALNVCASGLSITTVSLPAGTKNAPYAATVAASGGSTPYSFTVQSGALPNNLTLATNGAISGTPTATGTFTFTVAVTDNAATTVTKAFSITINPPPCDPPTHTISQVQGNGNGSPLAGTTVSVRGTVTGRKSNGFFLQAYDADYDADINTSEGIFVFTSSTPTADAAVGNNVCVSGTVIEFLPTDNPADFTLTEISAPTVTLLSSGNSLPAPIVLTTTNPDAAGSLLQLEKFEGMRVQVSSLTVVAPTGGTVSEANATSTSSGFFTAVVTGVNRPFREPGHPITSTMPSGSPAGVPRWDENPELLVIGSTSIGGSIINVAAGDQLSNFVGVLDFSRRNYTLCPEPANPPTVTSTNTAFIGAPVPTADELTVASYNMERFFDNVNDPLVSDVALTTTAFNNRLNKASLGIRKALNTPDILAVIEMENLSTLQTLAAKINSDAVSNGDANPNYSAYLMEGNDIGGIDVGFLVKADRVTVGSVTQFGKNTTYTNPTTGSQDILNDRPPLVLEGTFQKPGCATPYQITVIANHLRSLNGAEEIGSDGNRVRTKRKAQAEYLAQLIQDFQTNAPASHIISVGDYNAFEFNDGLTDIVGIIKGTPAPATEVVVSGATITSPALTNLIDGLPANARYSYSFGGSAQVLDHVLINANLVPQISRFAVAHLNADYPEILRGDANRPERLSDHDASVTYILFADNTAPVAVCKPITVTLVNGSATITAADVDGGSTDNCGIASLSVSKTSFDCSNIGPNEVTLTAIDAAGLTNTCKAIVTVVGAIPTATITAIPQNAVYTGGIPTNIYLGYGPQRVTLDAAASGGSTFSYAWSGNGTLSCTTCEAPMFAPTLPGTYTFTLVVTNDYGCTVSSQITICVADIRVPGTDGKKVYVCHSPTGNSTNTNTLAISVNAVGSQLAQAGTSSLGNCGLQICESASFASRNPFQASKVVVGLEVAVAPNPSTNYFTLSLKSSSREKITLRVTDISGRWLLQQNGLVPNTQVRVGENLQAGTYYAEVLQGNDRKIIKLMKIK